MVTQPPSQLLLGAGYMCLAMIMAAAIDVSVKAVGDGYGTPQIVLLRCLFALPIALWLCHSSGGLKALRTPTWGWQLLRGCFAAGANFGFFYGLAYIPLVTAVLLAYVAPVIIVLLARPLLGESVGLLRWLAVLLSFGGVLMVLEPDTATISPAAWAVLGSALCWALLSLSNRKLAGRESPAVLAFYTLPVSGLLAGLLTFGHWTPVATLDWTFFLTAGTAGGLVHLFAATAYRHAPAAAVAPFEYTALIWTAAAGYLFWNEVPDERIWLGGAAIITGGYLALQNPRTLLARLRRRPLAQVATSAETAHLSDKEPDAP